MLYFSFIIHKTINKLIKNYLIFKKAVIKMDSDTPCQRHDEQIKTLFKRADDVENIKTVMHSLDKNMAVQTQMLSHIIEHNIKQDSRMDNQENRAEKQDAVMVQMSTSLTELNDEVRGVKGDVENIKLVQNNNEIKHNIDLRDIDKEKYIDWLVKYTLPTGGAVIIIWQIIQYVK